MDGKELEMRREVQVVCYIIISLVNLNGEGEFLIRLSRIARTYCGNTKVIGQPSPPAQGSCRKLEERKNK